MNESIWLKQKSLAKIFLIFEVLIFCFINIFLLFFRQVDMIIQTLNQKFQVMTLNVSRPFGSNAVVQVLQ